MPQKDFITWLASYPRSGNTWFRALWHHYLELPTYAAHAENHRNAHPIPIGADRHDPSRAQVSALTKTHWRSHDDGRPAICLVRDGRDVAVSYFHYLREIDGKALPDELLQARIAYGDIMFGSWQNWMQQWLVRRKTPVDIVWTFDELISGLDRTIILKTLEAIDAPEILTTRCLKATGSPPTFERLQKMDPKFFRKGVTGDHKNYGDWIDLFCEQQSEGMQMWYALQNTAPEERGKMFR